MKLRFAAIFAPLFVSAALAQPKITFSGPAVTAGSSATVNVTLTGGGMNPAALQFSVSVPAGASITGGPALSAAGRALYSATSGSVATVVIVGVTNAGAVADGVIATISFPSTSHTFTLSKMYAAGNDGSAGMLTGQDWTYAPLPSPCDLNGDGKIDTLDVRNAIDQVDGAIPCANADLDADGQCLIFDILRVVTAASGGACRTGK